jgi:hypothetical protein
MKNPSHSGAVKFGHAIFLLVVIAATWNALAAMPLPEAGWHAFPNQVDLIRYYYPVARYQGEMLASGELPFWNPWQLAGFPLLAAPAAAILYPPLFLLTLLLTPDLALQAHAILHLFIGAWFVWLLLVRLGVGPLAATLGALAFAISDEILRVTELISYLSTIAWIPGLFWAIVALIDEPRFRRALALAAILSLSFLGGHGQGLLYAIYWAIPFGVAALLWRAPDAAIRIRVLGWLIPAALLTVLFSAPQLFPSLELMYDGSRSQDPLTRRQAAYGGWPWSVIWRNITAFASPGRLFGYPALLLGLLGLAGKSGRWAKLTMAALAIFAVLYMQGRSTPIWGFFYEMPLGKSFRNPSRISPVLLFLLSTLVGFGAQNLINLAHRWKPGRLFRAAVVGSLAFVFVGDAIWFGPPLFQYKVLRNIESWGVPDLPRVPPKELAYQRALLLDGLSIGEVTRQIKSGMVHRRMIVGDYEPLHPQPYLDLINSSSLWHGRMDLERTPEYSRLLNLMGVRETLAFSPLAALGAVREAQTQSIKTGDLWTVKRKSALPRTFVVYQTHVDANPVTARARILSEEFRPLQEAVVAVGSALQPSTLPQRGSATIHHYEHDRVEVDATCYGPCLLVLTDLFYPGWEARVEGEEIPIVKTDVAFRGVPLPAGQHRVEFRYRPLSFRAGAWLFLFGMAASIFGLWRDRRPRSA